VPTSLYFTTGQAAHQLGASQAQIRALCEGGSIASELTVGGQFRISAAELARLKREGLPAIPRPLPEEGRLAPAGNGRPGRARLALLDEPSQDAIDSADAIVILENEVKALDLKRQKEEKLDYFRERARQQANEEAEQLETERRRKAEVNAEHRREERENSWLAYAMNSVPYDARNEVEEEIHEQVLAALEAVRPSEPGSVVQRVVDAAVARVLRPWKRRKEINRAVEDARNSLPWEMKGICTPTTWDIEARKAAARALEDVRSDASYDEMRALAREAVKTVIAAFESQKAAQADAEMRQSVIQRMALPRELTEEGKESAIKAITQAFAQVPQGTPRSKLERICDTLLAPVREAIRAQQETEARRRQERGRRDSLKRATERFPWDMPSAEGEKALAAVRVAIDGIPEGATEAVLMQCRERAIQPFLETHARRKRTEPLIAAGLREILPFVQRLETDWEFDKSAHALEAELKHVIRKRLDSELSGSETSEDVGKKVRRLVRQELDIR
jgi:excisionase family DNA binding protein